MRWTGSPAMLKAGPRRPKMLTSPLRFAVCGLGGPPARECGLESELTKGSYNLFTFVKRHSTVLAQMGSRGCGSHARLLTSEFATHAHMIGSSVT